MRETVPGLNSLLPLMRMGTKLQFGSQNSLDVVITNSSRLVFMPLVFRTSELLFVLGNKYSWFSLLPLRLLNLLSLVCDTT